MTLRGLAWLSLTETGYVQHKTFSDDGGGGGTAAWTNAGTVDCRVDPIAAVGNEGLVADRIDDRSSHKITCPPETAVEVDGRFEVVGRGVYEVTAIRDRTDEFTRVFEAAQVS
jgi:hypothetical protein